jgi:hypothetical protein
MRFGISFSMNYTYDVSMVGCCGYPFIEPYLSWSFLEEELYSIRFSRLIGSSQIGWSKPYRAIFSHGILPLVPLA